MTWISIRHYLPFSVAQTVKNAQGRETLLLNSDHFERDDILSPHFAHRVSENNIHRQRVQSTDRGRSLLSLIEASFIRHKNFVSVHFSGNDVHLHEFLCRALLPKEVLPLKILDMIDHGIRPIINRWGNSGKQCRSSLHADGDCIGEIKDAYSFLKRSYDQPRQQQIIIFVNKSPLA